ncbi:MAG: ACT domain-containing protein [Lachnospiraceae bacterium]|nr:ACT domain-containing protein [Lachnospiraceae bacterium]
MELKLLNEDFTVCKVEDYLLVNSAAEYYFTGKTTEENSLVCLTRDVPSNVTQRDDGWKGFCIQGVLDFSLIGILSRISAVLADEGISIFAISTYNTDYIFIKEKNYQKALDVLGHSGYAIISQPDRL